MQRGKQSENKRDKRGNVVESRNKQAPVKGNAVRWKSVFSLKRKNKQTKHFSIFSTGPKMT